MKILIDIPEQDYVYITKKHCLPSCDDRTLRENFYEMITNGTPLDKIRFEITGKYRVILKGTPKDDWAVRWNDCIDEILQVIDKYEEVAKKEV